MNQIRPEMKDHPLAQAAREANDYADQHGLEATCQHYGLEPQDVHYMAEQRALRCLFATYGRNLKLTHPATFQLSESEEQLFKALTMACMDGLVIGWRGKEITNGAE